MLCIFGLENRFSFNALRGLLSGYVTKLGKVHRLALQSIWLSTLEKNKKNDKEERKQMVDWHRIELIVWGRDIVCFASLQSGVV